MSRKPNNDRSGRGRKMVTGLIHLLMIATVIGIWAGVFFTMPAAGRAPSEPVQKRSQTKLGQTKPVLPAVGKRTPPLQTSTPQLAALPAPEPSLQAGTFPLVDYQPQTPSSKALARALKARGLTLGAPVFIRIFKQEARLELWMLRRLSENRNRGRYVLFKAYKICKFSGRLGPKLFEGDKQAPEGIYTVSNWQLGQYSARWPQSINLGFPNNFDRAFGRTGSHLLIHGGCSSSGCFAMTNAVMDEIHEIVTAAFRGGQKRVYVHAFPFRLTTAALKRRQRHRWYRFWRSLQPIYEAFEQSHIVPAVSVCGGAYVLDQRLQRLSLRDRKKMGCEPVRSAAKPPFPAPYAAPARVRERQRRWGPTIVVRCNLKRPTCRRWLALQRKKARAKSKYPPRLVYRCRTCRRR